MKTKTILSRVKLAACAGAAAFACMAGAANAGPTQINITNLSFTGASTVDLTVGSQHIGEVYLGEATFSATDNGVPIQFGAFCVDLLHEITLGSLNLTYQTAAVNVPSSVLNDINILVSNGLSATNTDVQDAYQALIWQDLGASMVFNGADASLIQDHMSDIRAGINDGSIVQTANVFGVYDINGVTQGFATTGSGSILEGFVASAPEPSTWLLMFAGVGVLGFMLRRRRNQTPALATA